MPESPIPADLAAEARAGVLHAGESVGKIETRALAAIDALLAAATREPEGKMDSAVASCASGVAVPEDSWAAMFQRVGYRWPLKRCPCGDVQQGECLESGCEWQRNPALVPEALRIPIQAVATQRQPIVPEGPVTWSVIAKEIRSVVDEMGRRGGLIPQNADYHAENRAAFDRVAEVLEWFDGRGHRPKLYAAPVASERDSATWGVNMARREIAGGADCEAGAAQPAEPKERSCYTCLHASTLGHKSPCNMCGLHTGSAFDKWEPVGQERESDRQLMRFYSVDTIPALIDAQERHIQKLQQKLPPLRDEQPRNPRGG